MQQADFPSPIHSTLRQVHRIGNDEMKRRLLMSDKAPASTEKNDEHVLLNVEEAASFLRLTRSTLDHYRCEGKGPIYRKHGTRVFYTKASLIEWSGRQVFSSTSSRIGNRG